VGVHANQLDAGRRADVVQEPLRAQRVGGGRQAVSPVVRGASSDAGEKQARARTCAMHAVQLRVCRSRGCCQFLEGSFTGALRYCQVR
jgi:hypothetical protein